MDPTLRGGSSFFPVGTRDEIDRLHLDPSNVASCSLRTANNQGCPHFARCVFRQIRDGKQPAGHKKPLVAPECIAVFRQLSPAEGGEAIVIETTCFGYYSSGLHERRKQMGETGEIVKVLGVAGDGKSYKFKETTRAHVKKDTNCDDCVRGTCIKTKTDWVARPIEPFMRPEDRFKGHALGAEMRENIADELEREVDDEIFSQYVSAEDQAASP